jgi:hypothetical protein
MAAELKLVQPHLKVTLVHSRDKLLSSEPLPDDVKDRSLELLREANVDVLMSHRLDRTEEIKDDQGNKCFRVHFTNGHTMLADQVAMAISRSVPSTTFLSDKALDNEGYVKIQARYDNAQIAVFGFLSSADTVMTAWHSLPTHQTRRIILPLAMSSNGPVSSGAVPPCIWAILPPTTSTSGFRRR